MLFGVVILLTLTNLYRFCTNIHAMSIHHYLECCMHHIGNEIAVTIASLLTTINSSINCFIYFAASKDFRYYALDYFKRPYDIFRKWKSGVISNRNKKKNELESIKPDIKGPVASETFTSASTKINIIPVINVFLIDGENMTR